MLLIGAAMWHTNLRTGNSVSRKFSNRGAAAAAELLLPAISMYVLPTPNNNHSIELL